uniref:Uncharacterized protein n=1 Tax=Echeneis naucrates TaxID=173247 RepID=A0A665UP34_ECHNA
LMWREYLAMTLDLKIQKANCRLICQRPPLVVASCLTVGLVPAGVVGGILLVFICVLALLLWCLSRQKGSYVTNEMDDDDDIVNHEDGDGDEDEFVSSDVEPVKVKEED